MRALWTLIKHRLTLIRASQLHRIKVQSLMFTLRTLFVHRRAFARHLFSRADFSPVRVSRLHAVMEPKIRRSCDEFAFTVSERCVSTLASRVSFRQSIDSLALKKRSRKKAAGGWQLCAYVYPTVDARAVPSPRMDAMRKKLNHVVVAAASLKPPGSSSPSGIFHSFVRSTTHLLRANTPSRTRRTKPSSIA